MLQCFIKENTLYLVNTRTQQRNIKDDDNQRQALPKTS